MLALIVYVLLSITSSLPYFAAAADGVNSRNVTSVMMNRDRSFLCPKEVLATMAFNEPMSLDQVTFGSSWITGQSSPPSDGSGSSPYVVPIPNMSVPVDIVYRGCVHQELYGIVRNVDETLSASPIPFLLSDVITLMDMDGLNDTQRVHACLIACIGVGNDYRMERDVFYGLVSASKTPMCLCTPRGLYTYPPFPQPTWLDAYGAGGCLKRQLTLAFHVRFYCCPTAIMGGEESLCNAGCQPRGLNRCCYPSGYIPMAATTNAVAASSGTENAVLDTVLLWILVGLVTFGVAELILFLWFKERIVSFWERKHGNAQLGIRGGGGGGAGGLTRLLFGRRLGGEGDTGRLSRLRPEAESELIASGVIDRLFTQREEDAQDAHELEFVFRQLERAAGQQHSPQDQDFWNELSFMPSPHLADHESSFGNRTAFMEDQVCPVCLEPVQTLSVSLSCGHRLHKSCLKQYLKHRVQYSESLKCPMLGCSCVLE